MVQRSNITITGNPSGGLYPTLKRDRTLGNPDGPTQIMALADGLSDVTIEYLNFDGAYGAGASPPSSCNPCDGNCGSWNDLAYGNDSYVDLEYVNFNNSGVNAVYIQGSNQYMYQITISNGEDAGIHIGGGSYVQIYSSTFQSNYGAGIAIAGGTSSIPTNNNITIGADYVGNASYHNHWGQPDCSNGGQVYFSGTSTASLVGNIIDGEYSTSDPGQQSGVEVDPGVSSLTLSGNQVYKNGAEGEGVKWNSSAVISGDDVYGNGTYNFSFLGLQDCSSGCVSDPNVQLDGVTSNTSGESGSPYDLYIWGFNTSSRICSTTSLSPYIVSSPSNVYYTQSTCP